MNWFTELLFVFTVLGILGITLVLFGIEGCAGQGKQNLWEHCAEEIHQDCFEAEDVLDCGYERYRACIDEESL